MSSGTTREIVIYTLSSSMCKKKNGIKTKNSIQCKIKTLGKQSHAHLAVCSSGLLCVPGRPFLGVPASMESLQLKVAFIFFI